jgi:hypothetical protein
MAGGAARLTDGTPLTRRWAACTALATGRRACSSSSAAATPRSRRRVSASRCWRGASYALYTVASKHLLDDGHAPEAVMAWGFGLACRRAAAVLASSGRGDL